MATAESEGSDSGNSGSKPVFPRFSPRAPWWSGDLQTLRNLLAPAQPLPCAGRRLWLDIDDGSGDSLAVALHPASRESAAPLVVLIHGLTGCEDSHYIRVSTDFHTGRGFPVLRLNLRGAGPSRERCGRLYHAGSSEDLWRALRALDPSLTANGLVLVGYSLGGNMLLKFLAEYGGEGPFLAAATVSAPLDLLATAQRILAPRNWIYHRWLLRHMKSECLDQGGGVTAEERQSVLSAATVYAFDRDFTGPRNGYAGADDYYEDNSAARFLDGISVPTVMIHAEDDPWIPAAAYRRAARDAKPGLNVLLSRSGGHLGFHGKRHRIPWHDRCVGAFFDGVRA